MAENESVLAHSSPVPPSRTIWHTDSSHTTRKKLPPIKPKGIAKPLNELSK